MKNTIFISYCWDNSDLADFVDKAFQPTGIAIIRDIREIDFKGSITKYMKTVRSTDFVLLLISDSYLKSSNAMFEVIELLKDSNFMDKILPVIVDGTRIYRPEDRLSYIKYWTNKYKDLEQKLIGINTTDAIELYQDLKHYENIRISMGGFLKILSDTNSPKFSELQQDNFQKIFDYVGVSDQMLIQDILALVNFETDEDKDIEMDKLDIKYPNNPKVYFAKGYYAFEKDQIGKSNYFYTKSIGLDSSFGASYFNLGFNLETYNKDFEEAKKNYKKAIELEPTRIKAYINLAGLYSSKFNDSKEAKRLLKNAIQIDPFSANAYYNLALLLHRDFKEYHEALSYYELSIRFNNSFEDSKYMYGILLWKEFGRFSDAKNEFLEILKLNPFNKKALKQLGTLLEYEERNIISAKDYYDRFIAVKPNTAEDHHWFATFLIIHFLPQEKKLAREQYDLACSIDKSFESENYKILLR